MNDFIRVPYGSTVHGEEEINAVVEVLKTTTQMSKHVREFETKVAKKYEHDYGIMVNSGSSALYLSIEALNLPKGSQVITPALTFGTTIGCLIKNKLIPAFVDVEPLTYCIDTNKIEEMINDKTVAILAPNLMGNICNWEKISEISKKHGLIVIEDSADTLGGTINGKSSGYYSDMSITSFYGSHIINCAGNGGALMLNDKNVVDKAKLLRSWGRSSSLFDEKSEAIENRFNIDVGGIDYDAKFVFEVPGYNLEGNELGAAFGLTQLKSLRRNIEIREKNFNLQNDFFSKYDQIFSIPEQAKNVKTGWLAYPILINKEANFKRKDFQIFLEKRDIQTRVVFTGNIIRQPMMNNVKYRTNKNGYPNSDAVMERGVLLPLHHGMTQEMFNRLHLTIEEFIHKHI